MFSEGIIIYDSAGVNTAGVTATGRLKVDVAGETIAVTGGFLTDAQLRASPVPVSMASSPLPTGAATEATLLSIDAGIPAALGQTLMANSMPVVIASDQSILSVAINSDGVGLALDASVLAVDASISTLINKVGSTQYIDDDPHGVGAIGHFILAVRNDNLATTHTDTDGDYSPISSDSKGAVFVNDNIARNYLLNIDGYTQTLSVAVVAEDSAHASGDRGIMALAVRNDALATTYGANGDYSPISVDDSGAVAIWDGGRTISVDGTVQAAQSGAWTVAATQSGAWSVTVSGTVAVTQSGSWTVAATQSGAWTVAATQSGTWNVVAAGDVAHDSPDSGNPVKIGYHVEQGLPTAAANADRANAISDRYGRGLVAHIDPASFVWKSANYVTQQTGATLWQPSTANHRIAITKLTIGTYGTTSARVIIWFGSSADTTYSAGTDQLVFAGSFSPSSTSKPGAIMTFPTPEFCANTNYYLRITTDGAISIDVAVSGYEFIP